MYIRWLPRANAGELPWRVSPAGERKSGTAFLSRSTYAFEALYLCDAVVMGLRLCQV
jgi:hypothetical protein